MPRVVDQTPRARDDLLEIWLYIAEDNEVAADRLLARIDERLSLLIGQPHLGRARPELAPELRSIPVGNYVVFYIPSPEAITVVRVIEGHRDIELFSTVTR